MKVHYKQPNSFAPSCVTKGWFLSLKSSLLDKDKSFRGLLSTGFLATNAIQLVNGRHK